MRTGQTPSRLLADLALLFTVGIWGATFVMVQDAVQEWPVFAFLALRFGLAALAFLPLLLWQQRTKRASGGQRAGVKAWTVRLLPAVVIGLALAASYAFQTFGLLYTTPARAGFVTGMNVVIVPIGAAFFLRQPVRLPAILGVMLAMVGLALLSLDSNLRMGYGDLLVFFCAVLFAVQIVLTGRFAPETPPLRLAATQIATVAVVSGVLSLIFEAPQGMPPLTGNVLYAAAFTGLLATTFAFTAQSWAQQVTSATHTALIFSLEPVFAALTSYILIGEVLSGRELLGCVLILSGMLCAELGGLWLSSRGRAAVSPAIGD